MLTAVYAIVIFCLLIFVHEFGHFITARAVGIKVNEFSLGMGPKLLQFGKKETRYSLRAFPIGGYVKMEGEDEDSQDPRAFNNKSAPARALVMAAGSIMNVVLAVVIVAIMAMVLGVYTTTLGSVSPGSPAELAGLQAGDKVVEIDGERTTSWSQVTGIISASEGEEMSFVVKRDGERLTLSCAAAYDEEQGRWLLGITTQVSHGPFRGLAAGVTGCWDIMAAMVEYLGQLFTGHGSMEDLVGPVGIVSLIGDQARQGFLYIVNFTALISLNLAIINMLPLPALDGGRLLFLVIRLFTGRAISDETEGKIHFIGLMLLFALMIYLVVQDVDRFIFN
ncbi:MAG: RIP metalloprotease RseP [Bacillota bacterium]|nr:RIP metalloprotease RseP [Bacillota bacterium]